MSPGTQVLAGLGAGLAGGALSGLFGIGGGIVLVPLLALALGLDQHRAQGVTLSVMLLPIGFPAVLHYHRSGVRILWSLVGMLILGFLFGVLAGSWLANAIPERPMRWGFVLFLLLVALRMLTQRSGGAGRAGAMDRPTTEYWVPGLAIGFAGGMASGLLGIGGGIVMIPLLVWWLGFSQTEAQVTSLAVMLPPIGLPGVLIYAQAQAGFPWALMGGVGLGFAAGAYVGARGATRMDGSSLRLAFVGLVLVTAVLLATKR
ncbi:MAG: sulfite exporter TauE/SafE family protein [Holophagaceae bacterium]|nr:sulfite exporter TauE/SafE family protein [Holophagaceae bacterium]